MFGPDKRRTVGSMCLAVFVVCGTVAGWQASSGAKLMTTTQMGDTMAGAWFYECCDGNGGSRCSAADPIEACRTRPAQQGAGCENGGAVCQGCTAGSGPNNAECEGTLFWSTCVAVSGYPCTTAEQRKCSESEFGSCECTAQGATTASCGSRTECSGSSSCWW